MDVNIHKTNKVNTVLDLKRKKAKARTNAKKSNNTAFVRNPGVENVRVLDLGIQKLSTKHYKPQARFSGDCDVQRRNLRIFLKGEAPSLLF